MAFAVGKRVVAESESIARPPRSGVVAEVPVPLTVVTETVTEPLPAAVTAVICVAVLTV